MPWEHLHLRSDRRPRPALQELVLGDFLTSIQGGDLTSEINCPNAGKALVKTILSSTGLLTFADSDASIDEFVDTAYGCFCSLDLSGPEGQKIQTVLNTFKHRHRCAASPPPAATINPPDCRAQGSETSTPHSTWVGKGKGALDPAVALEHAPS